MKFPRASGILLHPTSLPSPFGIGDLGAEAYRFVDWLDAAGQTYWQVLPLSPTGYGDSPYAGRSAFAGNPLLISLEQLVEAGLLASSDMADAPGFPRGRVDFDKVRGFKTPLLQRAAANFETHAAPGQRADLARFCAENATWLDDFALAMALKDAHHDQPWYEWPANIRNRQSDALARWQERLAAEIATFKFVQWIFFKQWLALKRYANSRGVRIIGDIPIFVSLDSADVWAHTRLFHFDQDLQPTVVSGVPPDYFSETGQLWGHPLYRWDVLAKEGYAWWIERFQMAFTQADVARIDHFRGFYNYWEVPAGETTAVKGRWVYGPGADLFHAVNAALGEVAIIAEDLGDFDEASRAGLERLMAEFGYPGMKILQFAFASDAHDHFLPHNFTPDWVVYTGTHDNDTSVGWYQGTSTEKERAYARQYMHTDAADIAGDLIRLGWASVAQTAITTAQDLLRLDHEARMNTPSTVGPPNWCWRLLPGALTPELAGWLRELTRVYGREGD